MPLTQNNSISSDLGTRHRAAIGVSEMTDAVVLVVSEETGAVSIVKSGQIKHKIELHKLGAELKRALGEESEK